MRHVFDNVGIYLWPFDGAISQADPSCPTISNGFAYVTPVRGEEWVFHLQMFNCHVSHRFVFTPIQLRLRDPE